MGGQSSLPISLELQDHCIECVQKDSRLTPKFEVSMAKIIASLPKYANAHYKGPLKGDPNGNA